MIAKHRRTNLFLASIFLLALSGLPDPAAGADEEKAPTTYYLISDLHIGGDGALDKCNFEPELIAFLRQISDGPRPAELIIIGDAFGLWELTQILSESKMQWIADHHPKLFAQFRESGRQVKITLLPGNHDYDLACVPAYKPQLAEYNINLEPSIYITRDIAGRKIWIEHGNQHDEFNAFPDFGNRYGLPSGYFITADTVAAAARSAERGRSPWLNDLQSVYPTEEIPSWIWSNYFYKEMTPILRWLLLPFLLLFTFSVIVFLGQMFDKLGVVHKKIFQIKLGNRFGLVGRLIDWVVWINGVVISFLLILAIPSYLLVSDIRASLHRYGVERSVEQQVQKDAHYVAAAKATFEKDPSVVLYIYGHTHAVSLRQVGSRYVVNTGTWLKRLQRASSWFSLVPDVYVPSYRLNYFTVTQTGKDIRLGYNLIPKKFTSDLTWLESLMILGSRPPDGETIPAVTIIPVGQ